MKITVKALDGLEVKSEFKKKMLEASGEIIAERAKHRIKGGWLKPLHKIIPADLRWVLIKKKRGRGMKFVRPYGVRQGIYKKMLAERGSPIPVYKTGNLYESIKVGAVNTGKMTVSVEAKAPYSKIQNEGGSQQIKTQDLESWSRKYGVFFKKPQSVHIEGRQFLVFDKRCEELVIKEFTKIEFGRK